VRLGLAFAELGIKTDLLFEQRRQRKLEPAGGTTSSGSVLLRPRRGEGT
jgi:hypothetical protein